MFESERFIPEGAKIRTGVVVVLSYDGKLWFIPADRKENGFKKEVVGNKDGDHYQIVQLENKFPGHSDIEFPGGGVEDNETAQDAANRELYEELKEVLMERADVKGLKAEEKAILSAHFDDVFTEVFAVGTFIEFENLLVRQSTVDESTGVETLRAIFQLQACVVELAEEQYLVLSEYGVLIPESVADEWGLKKRPYLQALDIIRPKTEAGIFGK